MLKKICLLLIFMYFPTITFAQTNSPQWELFYSKGNTNYFVDTNTNNMILLQSAKYFSVAEKYGNTYFVKRVAIVAGNEDVANACVQGYWLEMYQKGLNFHRGEIVAKEYASQQTAVYASYLSENIPYYRIEYASLYNSATFELVKKYTEPTRYLPITDEIFPAYKAYVFLKNKYPNLF